MGERAGWDEEVPRSIIDEKKAVKCKSDLIPEIPIMIWEGHNDDRKRDFNLVVLADEREQASGSCAYLQFHESEAVHLNSTECRARPVVMPTDPEYNYYPYFVTLHRCSGGVHGFSPSHYKCVATKQDDVEIDVIVVGEWSKSDGQLTKLIREVNHTECGRGCVAKPEDCGRWQRFDSEKCTCTCPYSFAPYKCGSSKRWDPVTCSCDCKEPARNCQLENSMRVWSSSACGCVCDGRRMATCVNRGLEWDPVTCLCAADATSTHEPTVDVQVRESSKHYLSEFIGSQQFWYCVVVSEFVLLCVIFDLILYKKKSGLLYRLGNSCRSKSYNVHGSTRNLTNGMEEVD